MNLLVAHNYYRQAGGEDRVFELEARLLRENKHLVTEFVERNDLIRERSGAGVALASVWSRHSKDGLDKVLSSKRFDIAHFHNTFPRISPAAYAACRQAGVPVVQTLHNFRWICPSATLYRVGSICEECIGKTVPYPAIIHKCYHGSRLQSAAVTAMISFHRLRRTMIEMVDLYIVPTNSAFRKMSEGGFPEEKLVVKPHFVSPDPGKRERNQGSILFVGRLSEEKGVRTLLRAWELLGAIELCLAGDGQLAAEVDEQIRSRRLKSVFRYGNLDQADVMRLLGEAFLLVMPSEWYETFGRVVIEAFACGVPVLCSSLGALQEIVKDGATGLHFEAGNPTDLANKVRWAVEHPREMCQMGENARKEYEKRYTAEKNYKMLMDIYDQAYERNQTRHRSRSST